MKILRKLEKQKRLSKSVIRLLRYGNIDTLLTLREVFCSRKVWILDFVEVLSEF